MNTKYKKRNSEMAMGMWLEIVTWCMNYSDRHLTVETQ